MRSSSQLIRLALASVIVSVVLTACGGGGDGAGYDDRSSPPAPMPAALPPQPLGVPAAVAGPNDKVSKYDLEGAVVAGGAGGAATGNFHFDWTTGRVTGFAFATPFGPLDGSQADNTVSFIVQNGFTQLVFANKQLSLTLNYVGAPRSNDVGFFGAGLCTVKTPCTAAGVLLPVSKVLSKQWSSNLVWVPNLVWVADLQTVTNTVWESKWVWVPDITCTATDANGTCTSTTDNGFWEDDGGYVDEGTVVDLGSYVDLGAYVDTGTYPVAHFKSGLTVLSP